MKAGDVTSIPLLREGVAKLDEFTVAAVYDRRRLLILRKTAAHRAPLQLRIRGFATPSFEEGRPRRSSKCNATLNSAQAGRSDHRCGKVLTSIEAARYRACAAHPAAPSFKV